MGKFAELYREAKGLLKLMNKSCVDCQQMLSKDYVKRLTANDMDAFEDYLTLLKEVSRATDKWELLMTEGSMARLPAIMQVIGVSPELYNLLTEKPQSLKRLSPQKKTVETNCC